MPSINPSRPSANIFETLLQLEKALFAIAMPIVNEIQGTPAGLVHKINIDRLYEPFKKLEDLHGELKIIKREIPNIEIIFQNEFIGQLSFNPNKNEIHIWKDIYLPCKGDNGRPIKATQSILLIEFLNNILSKVDMQMVLKLEQIALSIS